MTSKQMMFKQKFAKVIPFNTKRSISKCVRETRKADRERSMLESAEGGDSLATVLQRAVQVFTGLKPLLQFLAGFWVLPQTWRNGVTLLIQALDSLALVEPQVTLQFKAGKDLAQAA